MLILERAVKRCTKCKIKKPLAEFSKRSASKDGLNYWCKLCVATYGKIYRQGHKEERTAYDQRRKEEKAAYDEIYRLEHKEERNAYVCERRRTDPNYKLACDIRASLNRAVKNNQKSDSVAVDDLGCSMAEFKLYIQHQFELGMTWENRGEVWEFDHVIPLASYELTSRMEYLEACNWLNVRPLFIKDHQSKGAKV